MNKLLTFICFVVATISIVFIFVSADSYNQLALAAVLYPIFAYFALKMFPQATKEGDPQPLLYLQPVTTVNTGFQENSNLNLSDNTSNEKMEIVDIDKRTFLKLLGTAGISFIIFSLLGRKTEELFFGKGLESSLKTSGILPETPAQPVLPSEGYRITEIDDDIVSYYGFTESEGTWIIMREDTDNNSFRYSKGNTDFSGNWQNRETLTYDYYHNLF